jgi:hypothetical protein
VHVCKNEREGTTPTARCGSLGLVVYAIEMGVLVSESTVQSQQRGPISPLPGDRSGRHIASSMGAARSSTATKLALAFGPLLALSFGLSHADEQEPERAFKFTAADYHYSDGIDGQDLNLRWRRSDTDIWVGGYRDPNFGTQARTGFDTSISLGGSASLQPSLQAATRGFVGGSLNFQIGDPLFALIGWGRTNLKPYFNLNFDPNDAITAQIGWHGDHDRAVSLMLVADDRLHTGQKDWHLNVHSPLNDGVRGTFDLLRKTGEGDSGMVRAWGWSATLDFPTWFLRLARDPKQNFSAQDATRLAAGFRF